MATEPPIDIDDGGIARLVTALLELEGWAVQRHVVDGDEVGVTLRHGTAPDVILVRRGWGQSLGAALLDAYLGRGPIDPRHGASEAKSPPSAATSQ